MAKRPGGPVAARPLQFIWIIDCSGSMSQIGKIQSLNTAIREAIPHMQDVAKEHDNAEVLVRVVTFSSGAAWNIEEPTPVNSFTWVDLSADGVTDMGRALRLVAEALKPANMPERGLPPVLVLVSDGQPTDDFKGGLKELMDQPWGKRAVRLAISIGHDAVLEPLQQFIGNLELKPLQANNPEQLVKYIKWASTVPVKAASSPASQTKDAPATGNVNIPVPPPPDSGPTSINDVW
jgi:uncharacterized protein YegL